MSKVPFKDFGSRLKTLRSTAKESISDVSGAVEVDSAVLLDIEAGNLQPTEDLIMLLISHFSLKEDEATKMWQLAGYSIDKIDSHGVLSVDNLSSPLSYDITDDVKIVYTDMVQVTANKYGVVMNFMQGGGLGNQPLAVSRVGMSLEHAKSMLEVLQKTVKLSKTQADKEQTQ